MITHLCMFIVSCCVVVASITVMEQQLHAHNHSLFEASSCSSLRVHAVRTSQKRGSSAHEHGQQDWQVTQALRLPGTVVATPPSVLCLVNSDFPTEEDYVCDRSKDFPTEEKRVVRCSGATATSVCFRSPPAGSQPICKLGLRAFHMTSSQELNFEGIPC